MLEKAIEKRLKMKVEKAVRGSMCVKFVSPGQAGVPDRVVLLPNGSVAWVEVKRPGEKPRPLQTSMHRRMAAAGATVVVVDSPDAVDRFVQWCSHVASEGVVDLPRDLSWDRWVDE